MSKIFNDSKSIHENEKFILTYKNVLDTSKKTIFFQLHVNVLSVENWRVGSARSVSAITAKALIPRPFAKLA